jgi:3-oxoadipate enol-lactonase
VIGLSVGGCVAQALALRSPDRVRSLVLVNTFARLTPAGPRAAGQMVARLALLLIAPMRVVANHVARDLFPKPGQEALRREAAARIARTPRSVYLFAVGTVVRFDARAGLGRIRCPTLVVAGDRDTTIPLGAKEVLVRGIPGARLAVVPDSGHVSNWDQPETFNNIVLEFLSTC